MASALEARLGDRIADAIAVIPALDDAPELVRFDVLRGEHPVPGRASEHSAHAALDLVRGPARRRSGDRRALRRRLRDALGALALACSSIGQASALTEALLRSGAPIRELNLVRQASLGRQGRTPGRRRGCARASLGLVLSDVPGNDLATIGSGPTAADPTTVRRRRRRS